MVSMDIFKQDPFSMIELTSAIERIPYRPGFLTGSAIFTDNPIRTTALAVEERNGVLSLIQTSQRGAPPANDRTTEKRTLRYFSTPRLAHGDTLFAHEIQAIRAFGQETELMQAQAEVARRLSGPTGLMANMAYTFENMALAAVQGQLLDADGSVLYNWFDEFGFAAPAEVAFNLAANAANTLRPLVNGIVRGMARASKGAMTDQSRVMALCGDLFWDEFVNHPDVIRTYLNFMDARDIRGGNQGGAFTSFDFADVTWVNYRGSDDNTTIKIPDDKVKFFPTSAPGVFERALSPYENFDYVNTPGKEMYVQPVFDLQRNQWWRMELYSYPLYICKRPEVLQTGRAGA